MKIVLCLIFFFLAENEALTQWDERIARACNNVNDILESINAKFPQLVGSSL